MIKIENLEFKYPDNQFNLTIEKLEIPENSSISVYGPSGSGKSTFLSLLAGILPAEKGEIFFSDQAFSSLKLNQLKKLRLESFGFIFQQPRLIDWMSVKDNILLPGSFLAKSKETEARLNDLSSRLGVKGLLNKNAGNLSLGEQMRVSTIRAIIHNPKLILADEPTASLDPDNQKLVNELLINETKKNKSTLILVSHDDKEIDLLDQKLSSETWELQ